ncbi:MAG: dihydrofolate reductase family protein [Chloroflexota bacterium]|nr:dihydrofolate reductase family protein [Chloroflexota bacterium]MDE2961096.1 dihydrofolate reductase family protein [Chloroflexota bacterium]
MARIVYYVAASLDGFIADSAGGVGWLPDGEADDYGYAEFYAGVEALVMGRRTYDQVLSFGEWPYPGKRAYVLTHSPPASGPPDVQFMSASAVDFARDIASRHSGTVWLVGGADLADQFRQSGLIDEYQVFVIPTILGQGVPLFGGEGLHTLLQLDSAQSHADGVVQLRYRPRNAR